ncbi:MAG TPA: hypothetical protein VGQ59_07575 [Cyclobacteriaceae bacterium]|jgi:hypothetical protein|nr:hypothetical protein [Cyclobacteriaceae bacterium]
MIQTSGVDIAKVKTSYFNLLAVMMTRQQIESKYIRCLVKWGIQLGVNVDDLKEMEIIKATIPSDKAGRLEALYHLIYMIYLDKVVEDVELEVATTYAEKLGFQRGLVGDLFKSIATLGYDNYSVRDVRKEVEDFLKLQNS